MRSATVKHVEKAQRTKLAPVLRQVLSAGELGAVAGYHLGADGTAMVNIAKPFRPVCPRGLLR